MTCSEPGPEQFGFPVSRSGVGGAALRGIERPEARLVAVGVPAARVRPSTGKTPLSMVKSEMRSSITGQTDVWPPPLDFDAHPAASSKPAAAIPMLRRSGARVLTT